MSYHRSIRQARPAVVPARTGIRTTDRAGDLLRLEEKLLSDFKTPPPHLVPRAPVVALEHVEDAAPRVTALPPRRTCLMLAHHDAALLVVALGTSLRLGAGATTALSAEELGHVRLVATLLHRILPKRARAAIRQRAASITVDADAPADCAAAAACSR